MEMSKIPDGYRLLKDGEDIKEGDRYLQLNPYGKNEWKVVDNWAVGWKFSEKIIVPMITKEELSAREKCIALYHMELAKQQEQKLLTDPLRQMLADRCGFDILGDSDYKLIIGLGKAISWSRTYTILAQAIVEAFENEMDDNNFFADQGD